MEGTIKHAQDYLTDAKVERTKARTDILPALALMQTRVKQELQTLADEMATNVLRNKSDYMEDRLQSLEDIHQNARRLFDRFKEFDMQLAPQVTSNDLWNPSKSSTTDNGLPGEPKIPKYQKRVSVHTSTGPNTIIEQTFGEKCAILMMIQQHFVNFQRIHRHLAFYAANIYEKIKIQEDVSVYLETA